MKTRILFLCLLLLLAACSGDDDAPVPTVFTLPTAEPVTPTDEPSATESAPAATITQVSAANTLPPSWTPTETPATTETATVTPSLTITNTNTPTPTNTPSVTPPPSGLLDLAQTAAVYTPLPQDMRSTITPGPSPTGFIGQVTIVALQESPTPLGGDGTGATATPAGSPVNCPVPPPGIFGQATTNNPALLQTVGCPVGSPPTPVTRNAAVQLFQNGLMLWTEAGGIYALYDSGTYQQYADTFDPNVDPDNTGLTPPEPGLLEPVRGFGKVWRSNPAVQQGLGWAVQTEYGDTASVLDTAQGQLIHIPTRGDVLALSTGGAWQVGQP